MVLLAIAAITATTLRTVTMSRSYDRHNIILTLAQRHNDQQELAT